MRHGWSVGSPHQQTPWNSGLSWVKGDKDCCGIGVSFIRGKPERVRAAVPGEDKAQWDLKDGNKEDGMRLFSVMFNEWKRDSGHKTFKTRKHFFYCDWTIGPVCPDRLWWLHPWGSSRPKWTQTWATYCGSLCFEQRLELGNPQMPLPNSAILRFWDSPSHSSKILTFFPSFCSLHGLFFHCMRVWFILS